ncbi:hypothetical protein [Pantoea vagans]|uniref:Uncharacterized protein n=1 Tax=Pantoea vagans TaxID=470934 RepID=A0AAN1NQQ1_9GAMM|nr:hypothetical protein [Pantoea vagans]AVV37330.1 hypothetical protein C9381_09090 [Pantoea vagans]
MSRLSKSVTFISELLAAAAIVASATTFVLDKLVWSKQVDITASLVNSGPKSLSILMSNNGQVDVAIRKVTIDVLGNSIKNLVKLDAGGEILTKNSSKLINSTSSSLSSSVIVGPDDNVKIMGASDMLDCVVNINYIAAGDDVSRSIPIKAKCYPYCVVDPEDVETLIKKIGSHHIEW